MPSRRLFLAALIATAGAACSPAVVPEKTGLRGQGTVLRPPEPMADPMAEPAPTRETRYSPPPTPTSLVVRPQEQIVAPEAVAAATFGGTEAEAHVIPVPDGGRAPVIVAMPAKRLVIPTIGVDTKVLPLGTKLDRRGEIAWETAAFAVGHHSGTAGPGQRGNMVLSGHISSPSEGAVFSKLPQLKVGQGIIVATEERQFLYQVVNVQTVTPAEVSVLAATDEATATLITCVPDRIYSHRLIISATLA
jgi:LPXTG-site transpeptidase (sortase) family protein